VRRACLNGFVCVEHQDMRRSFDTLALVVRERLALDLEGGGLFVFASKRGNRLKVRLRQIANRSEVLL